MTRRPLLLLGLLVVVQVILAGAVFVPAPHSGGDNAGYVALAHSLASGEGYTEGWDPAAPPHTKYPPVFPLLLALAMALGATGWAALKAVPFLASVVVVAAVFLWARRRVGDEVAFGVALLTGLAPSLLYHSHWILSDVPFLAFTVLALWALEGVVPPRGGPGADGPEPASRPGAGYLLGGTVLAVLAYLTRSAGLPLVVAGVASLLIRGRRGSAALFAGGTGAAGLLWWLRGRGAEAGQGEYGSEFFLLNPYDPDLGRAGLADFAARIGENAVGYLTAHLPQALTGGAGGAAVGVTLVVVALAVWGWVRGLRRSGVAELFLPLYLGLILLWPQVWSGDRFALPLVPLLLLFAAVGARELARRIPALPRVLPMAVVAAGLAILAGRHWIDEAAWSSSCRQAVASNGPWSCVPSPTRDFVVAARWSGVTLPPGSVALTRKPRIWYLMSGIPSRTYPFTDRPGALIAEAERSGARYVVLDFIGGQGIRFVGGAVAAEPGRYCGIQAFGAGQGAVQLLGIVPDGASGSALGAEGLRLAPCPPDYLDPDAPDDVFMDDPRLERIPLLDRGGTGG